MAPGLNLQRQLMVHSDTKERIFSGPQQSCNQILSTLHPIFEDGCLEENMITTTSRISLGDGGHRCKKFPCPVCNPGRAAIHGRRFRRTLIVSPGEYFPGQISLADPGHSCKDSPCDVCGRDWPS